MEKYCSDCGRVFGEVDYKLCLYCGERLEERVQTANSLASET